MPHEPSLKQAVAFVDGQNLFRCAKTAFHYHFPNYDVNALASTLCAKKGWQLKQVRFYTGIPHKAEDLPKNLFWNAQLNAMKLSGIKTFSRLLHYRNQEFGCPENGIQTVRVGVEKGIDVRIAIDVIRMAHHQDYDVALILSQDQSFSEVAKEVRVISKEQDQWIKIQPVRLSFEKVVTNQSHTQTPCLLAE